MPPADTPGQHELAERCRSLIKTWAQVRGDTQRDLGGCRLHDFDRDCHRLAEARQGVLAPASACRKLPKLHLEDAQFPELNCTIVNVPESCAKIGK